MRKQGREGSSSKFWEKNPQVHLNNHPILKNLDNFSTSAFYLTLLIQLDTKKNFQKIKKKKKKFPAVPYFGRFNEINPQPYLVSVFSME